MSEAQSGGALEPHNPYSSSAFSKTNGDSNNSNSTTNGDHHHHHHITELSSSSPHLTLLKSSNSPTSSNSSGLPSLFTFGEGEGLGSRLSDAFSEIRYAELSPWDLNLNSYPSEGLTARLIDSRSISIDSTDHYRPWEKPDSTPSHQSPTSTSNNSNGGGGGPPSISVTPVHPAPTPTPENVISSTNDKSSPTTLTPLTNVFPVFTETFPPQTPQGPSSSSSSSSQKLTLPSFQSQFTPFQETQPPTTSTGSSSSNMENNSTPTTSLPSFHTLPANRVVSIGGPVYHAQPPPPPGQGGHPVPHPHPHQFLEERHIQIFPGQVQFGQLITAPQQSPHHHQGLNGNNGIPVTLSSSSSNNSHPPPHHFNGGGGNGPPTPFSSQQHPPTIQLQELVPMGGIPHLIHLTNGKGHPGGPDGLNLNIIHHDPLNHHQHHPPPPPHLNINMPKYIHGAGIVPGSMPGGKSGVGQWETTHLIAVNPNMIHHQHQPQIIQHNPHNGHHGQIKLEQQQCSPNTNGMVNNNAGTPNGTPKRQVHRKRKTNNNHNQHHHPMDISDHPSHPSDLDPQVSSVSSSDSDFHRRPGINGNNNGGMNGGGGNGLMNGSTPNNHLHPQNGGGGSILDGVDPGLDKPVKKKRKRCGECIGCQRKDNCGDCAPCRNDKSHQICKMRRCDKLTEKKTPKVKLKQGH